MTLRELLKQNELRVVEVAAGADGLAHTISGAVMSITRRWSIGCVPERSC